VVGHVNGGIRGHDKDRACARHLAPPGA
jgi:hypothetical protein